MSVSQKGRFALGVSLAALGILAPASALAQDAGTNGSQEDEIIVTATKRDTALSDTPLAISVLTGEALDDAGVETVADLQNVAPSVQIGRGDFGVTLNIRGVTTTDNTSKGDQGIAFNVDGITVGRPREMGTTFFDIDRIEVLRGPQGTLYGKSTTGGVINVLTNRPTQEFGGALQLEYGNFDTTRAEASLNIPVSSNLALRGAVSVNQHDGYLPADSGGQSYNDQDDYAGRLSALFDFSPTTSLFVSTTFGHIGGAGPGAVPFGNFVPVGSGVAADETLQVDSAGESGRTVIAVPEALVPELDEDFANITAEFNTEFQGVRLTYLVGHREYDANSFSVQTLQPSAIAGPPPPVLAWDWGQYRGDAVTDQHEIRFANADSARLNWIVGYNWYREELSESDHRWSAPVGTPTREDSIPGIDPLNSTNHESSGLFGQIDYGLTDTLNLTLGARYSEDEVVRRGTFAVGPGQVDGDGNPCVYPNDCVGGPNNGEQSDGSLTWRVGFDWHPAEDTLIYGSVATGYKAGGFNDFDPSTGGPGPYDPEELIAYELGYRGEVLPGLTWDSALFFYDYSAAQISSLTNVSGNVVLLTKLAEVEVTGWENDFTWRPSDNDVLRFGFSLMNGEFTDFTAGGHAPGDFPPIGAEFSDWSGRPIDKVSDLTLRFDYSHEWNLANGALIRGRLASRYDSGYVVSDITDAYQVEQNAYTRSDANLTYEAPQGAWSLGVFVRNIEDEVQIISAPEGFAPGAENTVGVGVTEPRVYGVRFGLDFH
jgi:iron complex outermembrane receptor protein